MPVPEGKSCGDGVIGETLTECEEVCSGAGGEPPRCEALCYGHLELCEQPFEQEQLCSELGFTSGSFTCSRDCRSYDLFRCDACQEAQNKGAACFNDLGLRAPRFATSGPRVWVTGYGLETRGLHVGLLGPDLKIRRLVELGDVQLKDSSPSGDGLLLVLVGPGRALKLSFVQDSGAVTDLVTLESTYVAPVIHMHRMLGGSHLVDYHGGEQRGPIIVRPGGEVQTKIDEPVLSFTQNRGRESSTSRTIRFVGLPREFRVRWWDDGHVQVTNPWGVGSEGKGSTAEPWTGGKDGIRVSSTNWAGGFVDEVTQDGQTFRFEVDRTQADLQAMVRGHEVVEPPLQELNVPLTAAYCYEAVQFRSGANTIIAVSGFVQTHETQMPLADEAASSKPETSGCEGKGYSSWALTTLLRAP